MTALCLCVTTSGGRRFGYWSGASASSALSFSLLLRAIYIPSVFCSMIGAATGFATYIIIPCLTFACSVLHYLLLLLSRNICAVLTWELSGQLRNRSHGCLTTVNVPVGSSNQPCVAKDMLFSSVRRCWALLPQSRGMFERPQLWRNDSNVIRLWTTDCLISVAKAPMNRLYRTVHKTQLLTSSTANNMQ